VDCVSLRAYFHVEKIKMGVSGTIEGVEYFKCDPGYGAFVTVDKLIKPPEKVSKSTKPQRGSAFDDSEVANRHPSLPEKPISDDEKCVSALPTKMQTSKLIMKPLSKKSHLIGTTVFFSDNHHNSVSGTVRWIGENEADATEYVGVEVVSYSGINSRTAILIHALLKLVSVPFINL